jgi:hypothetical protein
MRSCHSINRKQFCGGQSLTRIERGGTTHHQEFLGRVSERNPLECGATIDEVSCVSAVIPRSEQSDRRRRLRSISSRADEKLTASELERAVCIHLLTTDNGTSDCNRMELTAFLNSNAIRRAIT